MNPTTLTLCEPLRTPQHLHHGTLYESHDSAIHWMWATLYRMIMILFFQLAFTDIYISKSFTTKNCPWTGKLGGWAPVRWPWAPPLAALTRNISSCPASPGRGYRCRRPSQWSMWHRWKSLRPVEELATMLMRTSLPTLKSPSLRLNQLLNHRQALYVRSWGGGGIHHDTAKQLQQPIYFLFFKKTKDCIMLLLCLSWLVLYFIKEKYIKTCLYKRHI